jgi:ferredoxin
MRTPKIDKDKCIGCGVCPSMAASTFKRDDEATIQMAMDSCPTQAISWEGRISEDVNPA